MNTASTHKTFVVETRSTSETIDLGKRLGRLLGPGCIIGLEGPLGAGKTYLTKGIAVGAGVSDERFITSPTFVLMNSYPGRTTIRHLDYYRLDRDDDLVSLGWYDFMKTDILICEWADKIKAHLGPDHLYITLEILGESHRRITLAAVGPQSRRLLSDMEKN